MLFSPFWVKGCSLFSFLGVWGKPRWSWTANWSRSFVMREKGTPLNSTCLAPKPLASSVYVHVPQAHSPHERSISVMSLFPSLSITATTLWVVPRSMPMIFSPSARPTPFQVSTTGTQDSLNEVFNQFATTRDNERPSTAFVPQPPRASPAPAGLRCR